MVIRQGKYSQRRWQIGFDGKETNVEQMQVDYVLGSGSHARSYLHRTASGAYIELPLGWYAEMGGYWAMSPGFDSPHPATRRFVSYECIFCHDAIPRIPAGSDQPGSDPRLIGDLPEGIDCQRCHGPGAQHIRTVGPVGVKSEEIRASIVNPARLTAARRMDLCMQCHLEPTSTEFPALIRRFNRGPFSYVPGEPLENFLLAFDHAPGTGHDDKFEIVNSSAYRLRKSQCFLKSQGAMTCETCHDPHNEPHGAAAIRHYSEVCRQCHTATFETAVASGRHPAGSECISCHMPKRRTEDVVHVVMTDHLIQRQPPARDLLASLPERHTSEAEQYRGEVVPYYPSPFPATPENILYRAAAQVLMRNNLQKGVADLNQAIIRAQPREAEFYMVLGEAWQDSGNSGKAAAAYESALRLKPDSFRPMLALARALQTLGRVREADEMLQRATRIAPGNALVWFQSGVVAYGAGRVEEAIAKMEKAITLDPDMSGGRTGLAELLSRKGSMEQAEEQLRPALRLDPYDATAYDLLGRVLAGKQQMAEALFDFERATRLRPDYAPHLYDYALALSSVNRLPESRAAVEAALRIDPGMAEAHALAGRLYAGERRLAEAAREYAEAVRLKPEFAQAHLDLARVLAAQGDTARAIEELRKAAAGPDRQIAEIATQALRRMGQ
jgi:predicted CXXCH cytochrome family protein